MRTYLLVCSTQGWLRPLNSSPHRDVFLWFYSACLTLRYPMLPSLLPARMNLWVGPILNTPHSSRPSHIHPRTPILLFSPLLPVEPALNCIGGGDFKMYKMWGEGGIWTTFSSNVRFQESVQHFSIPKLSVRKIWAKILFRRLPQ